ncbi:MAG: LysR family transcriptional regulator [Rhodobacteraceae bacterium]|nr:MAG: LysR family transcriptional regulator [Paracoccaceae bacterium]
MHNENWDDLRFALMVIDTGTVSAAARRLGVNHATVVRRVAALEARLGLTLFDKTPQGYVLAEDRLTLRDALREVEAAMLAVGRAARGGQGQGHGGPIRVTSTDSLCTILLPGILARIAAEEDGRHIHLLSSNQHVDLARMDADVAVRPSVSLAEDLAGEIAGEMAFGLYAAPGGAGTWLGLAGALARSRPARWMAEHVDEDRIAGAGDSFLTLRELAAAGQGMAILPRFVARGDPRLREVPERMPRMSVPVWVASHRDLADLPRLRDLRRRLVADLGAALAGH